MRYDQCSSCGVPYTDHPGIAVTCKRLENARKALRAIATLATIDGSIDSKHIARLFQIALEATQ